MSLARKVTAAVHAADFAIGRLARRRRVLVELRTPGYTAVLGPIADVLARDPSFDVRFTSEYPDRIVPLVGRGRFLSHRDVEWRRFALYLNADPWAAARLRRCEHRINFFHGVAGKYDLDRPTGLPMGFQYYDRVAFINEDRLRRYVDGGIVTRAQAALVGYPKLDRLARGEVDGGAVRRSLGLDEGRSVALYAPTYSTASSLHLAGEAIVRALASIGCSVIVKLHDRSVDPDPRYNGGIDWRTRMRRMAQAGRIAYVEDSDVTPYLAAADLMVTDHSSAGFEYLVLDRPLIVYDAPDLPQAARINPEKIRLLRNAALVAATPEGLASAASAALREPARLSPERRRVAEAMFHQPGGATDRAVALIRALLDRTAAASSRTAGRAQPVGGVQ